MKLMNTSSDAAADLLLSPGKRAKLNSVLHHSRRKTKKTKTSKGTVICTNHPMTREQYMKMNLFNKQKK